MTQTPLQGDESRCRMRDSFEFGAWYIEKSNKICCCEITYKISVSRNHIYLYQNTILHLYLHMIHIYIWYISVYHDILKTLCSLDIWKKQHHFLFWCSFSCRKKNTISWKMWPTHGPSQLRASAFWEVNLPLFGPTPKPPKPWNLM